jgi:hypothetical protein
MNRQEFAAAVERDTPWPTWEPTDAELHALFWTDTAYLDRIMALSRRDSAEVRHVVVQAAAPESVPAPRHLRCEPVSEDVVRRAFGRRR